MTDEYTTTNDLIPPAIKSITKEDCVGIEENRALSQSYEIMTVERIAFDVIRRKINSFENDLTNDEISGYVKGVVDLETAIYEEILKTK